MIKHSSAITAKEFIYPLDHWVGLEQFLIGDKMDAKGCFRLSSDIWDISLYADNFFPSEKSKYFFRFAKLQSFIKPYVKSYCYRKLIGSSRSVNWATSRVSQDLYIVDCYLLEHNLRSLDCLSSQEVFMDLWDALVISKKDSNGDLYFTNWHQRRTRPFWSDLIIQFDIPIYLPERRSKKTPPTAIAADKSKIIPQEVILQLSNKLALHRDKVVLLNRFDHLRLCVLMLAIATGRRINEILKAPRRSGPLGPLTRRPARGGSDKGTLFFEFLPLKGESGNLVCISPEWEDLTEYCVREVIFYGDEVRELAVSGERDLLILISGCNQTKYTKASVQSAASGETIFSKRQNLTTMLTSRGLLHWLNGIEGVEHSYSSPGVMKKWKITIDGTTNGRIYKLLPSQARHSRQNALAQDPSIPLLIKQRDLNHIDPNQQFQYQHSLSEDHKTLMHKLRGGELMGNGVNWLLNLVGSDAQPSTQVEGFHQGTPSLLDDRWRGLVKNNPLFIQFNRVPGGYCISPTGWAGCGFYMNCTETGKGGCHCFVTDPGNEQMRSELEDRARRHRSRQQESLSKGRTVQAGKHGVCADRTEDFYAQALYQIERLKERASKLKND